jgi:hypothetical protein
MHSSIKSSSIVGLPAAYAACPRPLARLEHVRTWAKVPDHRDRRVIAAATGSNRAIESSSVILRPQGNAWATLSSYQQHGAAAGHGRLRASPKP